jgi:hypothetical protein
MRLVEGAAVVTIVTEFWGEAVLCCAISHFTFNH